MISLIPSDKNTNRLSVKRKPIFLNIAIDNHYFIMYNKKTKYADMAELADAPDLGSGGTPVQVQVLLSAPSFNSLNLFTVGKMFGLFCFMSEHENFNG